jgi:hypothetical protein
VIDNSAQIPSKGEFVAVHRKNVKESNKYGSF